ncbi:unnamed protein product [Protopolystoma xenopodis]|uniref:Ion transport domain-containing protein n=1 Tax=Protopolystoma xenopodis TaxID=117903 RepID=A0A3S5AT42_9PLAT|nr:unnamed protein product [Protopolystoma xenopodis]
MQIRENDYGELVIQSLHLFYIYSFYVAMKTATSIGNLPAATNSYEFLFMTTYWLIGVYVNAILIGQIVDILDSRNANRDAYRKAMDKSLAYIKQLKTPEEVVDKVRTWYLFNWDQQKCLGKLIIISLYIL